VRTRRCSCALSRGFSILESMPAMVLNSGSKRCSLKVFSHSLKAIISRSLRCHSPSAGSRPRRNEKRVYTCIPPADQRLRLSPRLGASLSLSLNAPAISQRRLSSSTPSQCQRISSRSTTPPICHISRQHRRIDPEVRTKVHCGYLRPGGATAEHRGAVMSYRNHAPEEVGMQRS
jgi:hypothetical protein